MRSTRQEILNAAQRLIERDGSTRLTTKEIAREAGFAEGTLFAYFKRKEDLCLAVVVENSPKFREEIAQIRAGKGTVAKNLEVVAMSAIAFFDKLIPLTASLLSNSELLKRHRQTMLEQEQGPKDVFDSIAAYIEAERQLNRIEPSVAPMSAASLVLGPCFHRAFIRHAMGKSLFPASDQQFVILLIATLLKGLAPSSPKLRKAVREPSTSHSRTKQNG